MTKKQVNAAIQTMKHTATLTPDLDEDCQTVVGVPGSVQVVFVLLGDVWHHHVDQRLHGVMEGC